MNNKDKKINLLKTMVESIENINLYIEGHQQSQEKTSRQKDILDTWEEIQKVPFDRQKAIKQDKKNKIEFARFLYLLSRLEPKEEGTQKEQYRRFAEKMYRWIQSEKDCRQLKTALNLYAYMHRERGENYADK